jgi:hypothetical protein
VRVEGFETKTEIEAGGTDQTEKSRQGGFPPPGFIGGDDLLAHAGGFGQLKLGHARLVTGGSQDPGRQGWSWIKL